MFLSRFTMTNYNYAADRITRVITSITSEKQFYMAICYAITLEDTIMPFSARIELKRLRRKLIETQYCVVARNAET
jgi:hypothetical protein